MQQELDTFDLKLLIQILHELSPTTNSYLIYIYIYIFIILFHTPAASQTI